MKEQLPKICPQCSSVLYHNKGVSQKTGKPYENWKCGKCNYIKWADLKEKPPQQTGEQIILEEIQAVNERLDRLIAYIVQKLGK